MDVYSIMKKASSLALFLLLAPFVRGQITPATAPSSAGEKERIMLRDPGISMGRPTFFIPSRLMNEPEFSLATRFADDGTPVAETTRFSFSHVPKIDLLSPLRLQWARDAELKTLKTILGSVSFGGAAYLAVRSLQKSNSKPPLPRQIKSTHP
jgi:hypothetical protein